MQAQLNIREKKVFSIHKKGQCFDRGLMHFLVHMQIMAIRGFNKKIVDVPHIICVKLSRAFSLAYYGDYSAFANSCPMQTDTFLFPLIHSHNVILSSNKF